MAAALLPLTSTRHRIRPPHSRVLLASAAGLAPRMAGANHKIFGALAPGRHEHVAGLLRLFLFLLIITMIGINLNYF